MNISHRIINGITIIGEDLLAEDASGRLLNAIVTIFPGYRLIVNSHKEIHGMQINTAFDYINNQSSEFRGMDSFYDFCIDAVPAQISGGKIIIRMELEKFNHAFLADQLLQKIFPKKLIQFSGLHLPEVRSIMRQRGEIWRIAPAPINEKDFSNILCNCRIRIGSGIKFLYNKHTGEHVLTYAEFIKIRSLIRTDTQEAINRLKEIIHLIQMKNSQGYPELVFFMPAGRRLETSILARILSILESGKKSKHINEAETLFDQFSHLFSVQAGSELTQDNPKCGKWRETALSCLYNIDEKTTAEWALGLGPEFYLNIQWLPGARIDNRQVGFEPDINPKVKSIINYYCQNRDDFTSINVGSIICPLTERDQTGEEREVYIVNLGLLNGHKDIRHIRRSKWGVHHRLDKGFSMEQAIHETKGYRDYIIDRLTAARALGFNIPIFKEINVIEDYGDDRIPVYYFEREYIPGIVTNRIPSEFYERTGFLPLLAELLGESAAASLVLGRSDPRSYELYFDDGDEVIRLNAAGLPEKLILIETTGSFADWTTPLVKMIPHCLKHLASHIETARQQGIEKEAILTSIVKFSDGLITEIQRILGLLHEPIPILFSLFSDRTNEPKGIRCRWEGILDRIRTTDIIEIKKVISESPELAVYHNC